MDSIDAVLLDVSGVLYEGDVAVSGADDALGRLREAEVPFRLLTNTTLTSKQGLLDKLARLGFAIEPGDLLTPAELARTLIEQAGETPYLLIHPALEEDFAALPGGTPNAVVVGDAGEHFTYDRLNEAFRILIDGGAFYALATNRYFRGATGLELDAGPFVAALEYASGAKPTVIGKPSPVFFRMAAESMGAAPEATAMIGDDVEADVLGAIDAGFRGILVKTGKFRDADDARARDGGAAAAATIVEAVDLALSG